MKYIQYSVEDGIAFITLDRPDKSNALSYDLVSELKVAFKSAEDDPAARVVVLRANGDSFCAGADLQYLQELQSNSFEQNLADSDHLKELFLAIYQMNTIVIAQVHGAALAGGCGLATVADFVFAAPEATFGYTEVRIGFVPAIVMVFLLRKIGEARARQLLLGASIITAQEALEIGLIQYLAPREDLAQVVRTFAEQLMSANSSYAMGVTKQMIAKVQALTIDDALAFASEMNAKARGSDDCRRGIAAFLNKEKIDWNK